jgi:cell division protein FtsI (penicillin-binding protein 3)
MLDEPKGNTSTHNFATGGWVAAPAVGRVIARMAPVVALKPMREETQEVAQWRPSAPPPQKPLFISVRKAISDVRRRDIASN